MRYASIFGKASPKEPRPHRGPLLESTVGSALSRSLPASGGRPSLPGVDGVSDFNALHSVALPGSLACARVRLRPERWQTRLVWPRGATARMDISALRAARAANWGGTGIA
jgi:hypothetical protein